MYCVIHRTVKYIKFVKYMNSEIHRTVKYIKFVKFVKYMNSEIHRLWNP